MDRTTFFVHLAEVVEAHAGVPVTATDAARAVKEVNIVLGALSWTQVDATPGSSRWQRTMNGTDSYIAQAGSDRMVQLDVAATWAVWTVSAVNPSWNPAYASGSPADGWAPVVPSEQLDPADVGEDRWAWIAARVTAGLP